MSDGDNESGEVKLAHEEANRNENPASLVAQWMEESTYGTLSTPTEVEALPVIRRGPNRAQRAPGITIYFPFHVSTAESIPYHRWQSVRVAVLLAFAYFTLLHIFRGTKALYPIKFLEIFIKILTITGIILFYRTNMLATDYGIILFFVACSAILHVSARPRLRKYFSRK